MGAQSFVKSGYGTSIGELFNGLVEDAIIRNGDDSYNGTISTCTLRSCSDKFEKYSKANEKKMLRKIREVYDYGEKWEADYIDLGVVEYEVRTIKKRNSKYSAKYKQVFAVYFNDKMQKYFDKKSEADKYAMSLILKEGKSRKKVYVKKTILNINKGQDIVSNFEVETKTYKRCPKLKSMENRTVVPIHKYLIYGWAAC